MLKKMLACSVICEMTVIALFTCLCLKDKLGLLFNELSYPMTGNCSANMGVLASLLRMASAVTGNPSLRWILNARQIVKITRKEKHETPSMGYEQTSLMVPAIPVAGTLNWSATQPQSNVP